MGRNHDGLDAVRTRDYRGEKANVNRKLSALEPSPIFAAVPRIQRCLGSGAGSLHPLGPFHQPRGIRPPIWIIGDQTDPHCSQQ
jgi:hypothetical protein